MISQRPKIHLRKSPVEQVLTLLSYILIVLIIALPIYYYSMLPDTIAIHFNLSGKANGFGHKNFVWLTPALSLFLFITFNWLSKRPHLLNYPTKVNEQNAAVLYKLGSSTILYTSVIVLGLLCYLSFMVCAYALNNSMSLDPLMASIFVAGLLIVMVHYMYKTYKIKNK